jgi:hypothetical protein
MGNRLRGFIAPFFRENPQTNPRYGEKKTAKIRLLLQFINATSGGTVDQNISHGLG